MELARLANHRASNGAVRDLAARLMADQGALKVDVGQLAEAKGVTLPTEAPIARVPPCARSSAGPRSSTRGSAGRRGRPEAGRADDPSSPGRSG